MRPEEQYPVEMLTKLNEEANRLASEIAFDGCDKLADAVGGMGEDPIVRAVLTLKIFAPRMVEYAAALAATAIEGVITLGVDANNRDMVEEIMIRAVKDGISKARKICAEELAKKD